jgi:hypothetical protein
MSVVLTSVPIVTVQAYGALGCQVTRSIYSELGFRYLYHDYDSGGYLYKASTYDSRSRPVSFFRD